MFRRSKKMKSIPYDPAIEEPAIHKSICTGEASLGFLNKETGQFKPYGLADSPETITHFAEETGVKLEDLKTIY